MIRSTVNTKNPSLIKNYYTNNQEFKTSDYWEFRYANLGNSGAGSYGRLANFKAKVINDFVHKKQLKTVLEFGSGDGNQLSLANYPSYIGIDVSKTAVSFCKNKYKKDATKSFFTLNSFKNIANFPKSDVTLSLDVIYHIIEDFVFEEYMTNLFNYAKKYVIIYANNVDERVADHIQCRNFTKWIDANVSTDWELMEVIHNDFPYKGEEDPFETSMSDFYIYKKR